MFEGLFDRVLRPTGAFAEDLRLAGYDPRRAQPEYPTRVWHACLDVARRHVHAGLAPEEAYRRLGQALTRGFLDTLVGKLLGAAVSLLGPDGVMVRLHRFWGSGQPDARVRTEQVGPRDWRVHVEGPLVIPPFAAGVLEGILTWVKAPEVRVTVADPTPGHVVLHATWRETD